MRDRIKKLSSDRGKKTRSGTCDELEHMAMLAGAPFPEFYQWTWGEINEFISCKNEMRVNELKEQAYMDFKHAMLVCKILGSKRGAKFDVTKEYDFLWSEEERKNMEIERFKNQMLSMCKK